MSLLLTVFGEEAKANPRGHGYREAGPEGPVPRRGHVPNPQQARLRDLRPTP